MVNFALHCMAIIVLIAVCVVIVCIAIAERTPVMDPEEDGMPEAPAIPPAAIAQMSIRDREQAAQRRAHGREVAELDQVTHRGQMGT